MLAFVRYAATVEEQEVRMRPEEMIKHCEQQIEIFGRDVECVFKVPGKWGKKDTRRLCPGGPVGEIVLDNFDGRGMAVMFKATEVVSFLRGKLDTSSQI